MRWPSLLCRHCLHLSSTQAAGGAAAALSEAHAMLEVGVAPLAHLRRAEVGGGGASSDRGRAHARSFSSERLELLLESNPGVSSFMASARTTEPLRRLRPNARGGFELTLPLALWSSRCWRLRARLSTSDVRSFAVESSVCVCSVPGVLVRRRIESRRMEASAVRCARSICLLADPLLARRSRTHGQRPPHLTASLLLPRERPRDHAACHAAQLRRCWVRVAEGKRPDQAVVARARGGALLESLNCSVSFELTFDAPEPMPA